MRARLDAEAKAEEERLAKQEAEELAALDAAEKLQEVAIVEGTGGGSTEDGASLDKDLSPSREYKIAKKHANHATDRGGPSDIAEKAFSSHPTASSIAANPEEKKREPDSITESPPVPPKAPQPEKKECAARFVIGVDWSHNSPAVAILTPEGYLRVAGLHRSAGCDQRVESSFDIESADERKDVVGRVFCTLFPIPEFEKLEMAKIDPRKQLLRTRFNIQTCVNFIVDTVKQSVFALDQAHGDKKFSHLRLEIAMEDYAYGAVKQNPSTLTLLAEDAGAFKMNLFICLGVPVSNISISHVKKLWSGTGSATKAQMCDAWFRRGLPPFNLPCCINEKHPLLSPYNDMVDATAVLYAHCQAVDVEFIDKFKGGVQGGGEVKGYTAAKLKEWKDKMIDMGNEFRRAIRKEDA